MVLLVSHVDSEPGITSIEEAYLATLDPELAPKIDLVLLHPGVWREKCGTRRWLACRTVTEHHHIRTGVGEDFERLARIVTGNSIGLVLGGGGARGFSQIGVVRALREAGIPIDRVGGTSIGSVISAQVASNMSIDAMYEMNRRLWVEGKPLSDYTFPAMSIVRGRKPHNLLRTELAEIEIEDLPINYFCVSTNLSDSELVLHDSGPLWSAVRASGSLPGAGPPLFWGGKILVDGGVLNNLPGDIMRDRFGGIVIAVDVARARAINIPDTIDDVPSGWQILWRRINPFSEPLPVPTLFEILYRTATLSSVRLARRTAAQADVVIAPPVADYTIVDFAKIDEIIASGYSHAVEVLRAQTEGRVPDLLARIGRAPLAEFEGSTIETLKVKEAGRWQKRIKPATAVVGILIAAIGMMMLFEIAS